MTNRHLGRAKDIIASQKGPEPKTPASGDGNGRRPAHSYEQGRPAHSYEQGPPAHSQTSRSTEAPTEGYRPPFLDRMGGKPAPQAEAPIDKTDRRPMEAKRDFAPTRRERPEPGERRQGPGRGKAILEHVQAKRAAKREQREQRRAAKHEQRDQRRDARGPVGAQR